MGKSSETNKRMANLYRDAGDLAAAAEAEQKK